MAHSGVLVKMVLPLNSFSMLETVAPDRLDAERYPERPSVGNERSGGRCSFESSRRFTPKEANVAQGQRTNPLSRECAARGLRLGTAAQ
jgi:hypothetical protein